ncbi:MAG: glycosyltransferase family 2 protein [Candidatus Helarchaeota archaeon]
MNHPKVSIIILNWNGLKDTVECLESLKKITYPNYEVIVVDNDSDGDDASVLEKKYNGYIEVIRNKENLGFSGGNNVAIRKVLKTGESEYVLLLNNDTVVEPSFLDELIKIAESNLKIGIIGPKILNPNNSLQVSCWKYHSYFNVFNVSFFHNFFGNFYTYRNVKNPKEVDVVSGACILFKKKVLEKIGLLDKNIFLYSEETDICYRAKKAGYKIIYYPNCSIIHYGGQATKNILQIATVHSYKSKIYFFHKHYGKFKALILEKFIIVGLYERILFLIIKNVFKRDSNSKEHLLSLKYVLKWYKKYRKNK